MNSYCNQYPSPKGSDSAYLVWERGYWKNFLFLFSFEVYQYSLYLIFYIDRFWDARGFYGPYAGFILACKAKCLVGIWP